MNKSLKNELLEHAILTLEDLNCTLQQDLHYHAFNESEYVIGTWACKQWLAKHEIDAFEAIQAIIEY